MKTIKIVMFLILLSCGLWTGCKESETELMPVAPELQVQESAICDWKGTPIAIAVSTNQREWLAKVSKDAQEWCTFIPRRDSIILKPEENPLETIREALIIITAGGLTDTLKVTQEQGAQPYCKVTEPKFEFVWLETTLQTAVQTNQTSWHAKLINAPWCTIRILGNQILVTAEQNETHQPRKGELVITAGRAEPLTVPLVQEQKRTVLTGPIAIQVTKRFDISDVYEAWNGDQKIAEICNEYIPAIDDKAPVIVIYPIMRNGLPDLTNGLVATDGGHLAWNGSIATYTPGTRTEPLETIIFDNGGLSADIPENAAQAAIIPTLLKDIEKNRYRIVKIGSQFWLGDNVRTTTYADGTPISKDYTTKDGAWGLFEDKVIGKVDVETIGLLYNWYVLPRIAPHGWHVPDIEEWKTLQDYLGVTDAILMRKQDPRWDTPCNANNLSGFSALPGGSRWENGKYQTGSALEDALWWSSNEDEEDDKKAYYLSMRFNSDKTQLSTFKKGFSYSIRLLRN